MAARILLADDHQMFRQGIKAFVDGQADWKVCGEAANGHEAVEQAKSLKPDLVLMDVSMPIMNGIEATVQIRRVCPATKVIVLTMHDSLAIQQQAKGAGASACVVKGRSVEDLRKAIVHVLAQPADQQGKPR